MKYFIYILLVLFFTNKIYCQQNDSTIENEFTIVSYNIENLFDTINDPDKLDEDFTPNGKYKWTSKRYNIKINKIAKVLQSINSAELPEIIGLVEIENKEVLKDLISNKNLIKGKYEIISEESPDRRGIDVAILYRKDEFKYITHKAIPVSYPFSPNSRTRDILYVKGVASQIDTFHIFVNHWSSRRGGQEKSEIKRIHSAKILRNSIDSIFKLNLNSKIIIIGDFNDNPTNKSIFYILKANNKRKNYEPTELYNLLYDKHDTINTGTYLYKNNWDMLDNLIVSQSLLKTSKGYYTNYNGGHIYKPIWICYTNKNTGIKHPNRTYIGSKYVGGYSDHFPVYMILNKK
ncbi:MAG: endonuclease [Bacteroidales bacterium]|nr:endonuclease [Bacteroidales bacterium]